VGNADGIIAYCKVLHRADGYGCGWRPALPPRPEQQSQSEQRTGRVDWIEPSETGGGSFERYDRSRFGCRLANDEVFNVTAIAG
jgi:hypothetical protein